MDVKAVTPFDIDFHGVVGFQKEFVADKPHDSRYAYANADAIDEYHIQEKLDERCQSDSQNHGKTSSAKKNVVSW